MKKLLWVTIVLSLTAFLATGCGGDDDDGGNDTGDGASPEASAGASPDASQAVTPTVAAVDIGVVVEYESEDGVHVVATFAAPEGVENPPVVVLLHQFLGSRSQWRQLIGPLVEAGYAVLAPDLRAFGESTRCRVNGRDERCALEDVDDLLKDVPAALSYLKDEQDVDTERMAVIGASLGGNVAYVASGAFPEVDTAVSISPNANTRGGALLGTNVPGFEPRSVLFMADETESTDAETLAENVAAPVEVKVYEGERLHGVELLKNPQALLDILGWLEETL